jgi:hypothetical protein
VRALALWGLQDRSDHAVKVRQAGLPGLVCGRNVTEEEKSGRKEPWPWKVKVLLRHVSLNTFSVLGYKELGQKGWGEKLSQTVNKRKVR